MDSVTVTYGHDPAADLVRPEQHLEIVHALSEAEAHRTEIAVPVSDKVAARPRKKKRNLLDGLLLLDPEPLLAKGECPGGLYYYLDDVDQAVRLLEFWTEHRAWAAVDLETSAACRIVPDGDGKEKFQYLKNSDAWSSVIFLASVSVKPGEAVVFDLRTLMGDPRFMEAFRRFLTICRIVTHGGLFDQTFFAVQFGVFANICFETLTAHQIATAGRGFENGLDDLMARYHGIQLDKKWQKFFLTIHPTSPIPNEAIAYAAADVCQLLPLAQIVEGVLKEAGMLPLWREIEQPLLQWIAEARVTGIPIQPQVLKDFDVILTERVTQAREVFERLCPGVLLTSPTQLLVWFRENGTPIEKTDEYTLKQLGKQAAEKKNAKNEALQRAAQVATAILDFRGVAKAKTTYIDPFLKTHLNPRTGRIHPFWKQNNTDTGRMACGDPNFQNLHSRGQYAKIREMVDARVLTHLYGYPFKIVRADYSQFEVRVLANEAHEPKMLEVFHEGYRASQELRRFCIEHGLTNYGFPIDLPELKKDEKHPELYEEQLARVPTYRDHLDRLVSQVIACDFHSRTAATLFHGGDVTKVAKEERANAKTVTFALPYGAEAYTISIQAGISQDKAQDILDRYFATFPRVKAFLERCKKEGLAGMTQTPGGRRRFYAVDSREKIYDWLRGLRDNADAKWEALTTSWKERDPGKLAFKIHRTRLREVERQATNHPIQGCNADATKLATVLAAPRLKALHPECRIIMWVHDEIVILAPESVAGEAATILEAAMIEAAERYLDKVPVEVGVVIGDVWAK